MYIYIKKTIEVPLKKVSLIIGQNGSTIKEIRKRTNVSITLPKQQNDDDDDSKRRDFDALVNVILRGTPEEVRDGLKEVNFLIENNRLMLESERDGQIEIKASEMERSVIMNVPSKICGMLIGDQGTRVNEMQSITGAKIWVDWDTSAHKGI